MILCDIIKNILKWFLKSGQNSHKFLHWHSLLNSSASYHLLINWKLTSMIVKIRFWVGHDLIKFKIIDSTRFYESQ